MEYMRRSGAREWDAMVLYSDPKSAQRMVPVIVLDTMLRSAVAARGLKPGQRIRVHAVKIDPRRDVLKLDAVRE
jgi:hypothetical protein